MYMDIYIYIYTYIYIYCIYKIRYPIATQNRCLMCPIIIRKTKTRIKAISHDLSAYDALFSQ